MREDRTPGVVLDPVSTHSEEAIPTAAGVLDPASPGTGEAISQAGELRSARVESLRALAALAVMEGHIFGSAHAYGATVYDTYFHRLLLGGGFGVYLFFVLSGYLLYWPFAREAFASHGPVNLRRYAMNRALRILPLYYAVLVILLIVQNHGGTFHLWWTHAVFAESYSNSTFLSVDGVMWSLVTELHFYIALPLIAYAIARLARGSLRRGTIALLVLGVASFVLRDLTFLRHPQTSSLLRYQLPSMFWYFAFGMALAHLRLAWERRRPAWVRGPLASSDAWLLVAAVLWALVMHDYGWELLGGTASFLMVGACVLPLEKGYLVRALEWRVLAFIGVCSYSLYLWHLPIVGHIWSAGWVHSFLALFVVAAPASIAAATVSYLVIESPFLRLRRRWASSSAPTPEGPLVSAPVAAR
jgi:peptidoglycan/LPS O-acetylase OafA/YrhL